MICTFYYNKFYLIKFNKINFVMWKIYTLIFNYSFFRKYWFSQWVCYSAIWILTIRVLIFVNVFPSLIERFLLCCTFFILCILSLLIIFIFKNCYSILILRIFYYHILLFVIFVNGIYFHFLLLIYWFIFIIWFFLITLINWNSLYLFFFILIIFGRRIVISIEILTIILF